MEPDRQSFSAWVVLRAFAASFLLLFGLGMLRKANNDVALMVGAALASMGLTVFVLMGYTPGVRN